MFSSKKDDLPARLEGLKDKATEAVKTYAPAARDVAREKAAQTAEFAAPHLHAAQEWARPHVEHGVALAAPRVQSAVEGLAPKVDAAHDALVDDWLPKIAGMISSAASAAQGVSQQAVEQAQIARANAPEALAVLRGESSNAPMRASKKGGGKLLIVLGLAVGAVAVSAVLNRKKAADDPWAIPADTTAWDSPTGSSAGADKAAEPTRDAADAKDAATDEAAEPDDKAATEPTEPTDATEPTEPTQPAE